MPNEVEMHGNGRDEDYQESEQIQGLLHKLGCAGRSSQVLLVFINAIIMITTFCAIGFGVYALQSEMAGIFKPWFVPSAVLAGVILAVSITGVVGAYKEWRPVLMLYMFVMVLLHYTALILAVYAIFQQDKPDTVVTPAWTHAPPAVRSSLQTTLQCCGLSNSEDLPALPCPSIESGNTTTGITAPCGPILEAAFVAYFKPGAISGLALSLFTLIAAILTKMLMTSIFQAVGNFDRASKNFDVPV